jgi:glutaredoxin
MIIEEIKITILSQDDCHFCDMAKIIFNRFQAEFNLNIEMIDLNSPEGLIKGNEFGFLFPPGILINDLPFSYGRPSEKKIRKELIRLTKSK